MSPAPMARTLDCELSREVCDLHPSRTDVTTLMLVRLFDEPLGMVQLPADPAGIGRAAVAAVIARELADELAPRWAQMGLRWDGSVPVDGVQPTVTPPFVVARERVLAEGPEITVALCTRDRPEDLARALGGLAEQRYPRMRVLVVDNAPSDDRSQRVVSARREAGQPIDYVVEPRPGLSWARNRAVTESQTEVIAWCDDDEICDPWWLTEIARGFVEVPEAGAVTGAVLAAELATPSQALFERYSGLSRGRGFRRAVFSPASAREQSPLYPLPPYGAGANMAFRRSALAAIGGFDCALGTGTLTLAGEDTAALSSLLLSGGTVVYQPSAIVRHYHRRDWAALERVMLGYGRGLTAYYASMLA